MMQEFKNQTKKSYFWINIYHHYRQYVQFLNDFVITAPFTSLLIILPNIVMIMDLTLHVGNSSTQEVTDKQISQFFQNISYIGVSQAIIQILSISSTLKYLILILMILFLFAPFLTILQIFLLTFMEQNEKKQIGYFRIIYDSSLTHKFIRIFLIMFQYISMPVFTSVGIKIIGDDTILGTIILIFVPLVYLTGEYHLLQIMDQNNRSDRENLLILARVNFPNNIFDCILTYVYFILINKTSGHVPFIAAISIYILRAIVAVYFKYYLINVLKEQYFTLLSSIVVITGLYISYLCKQIYIVLIVILFLLILIHSVKDKINFTNQNQYENVQKQQISVEQLKSDLWKKGNFTYVFRQLIFQSRKNYSHRKQLLIQILKVKCFQLQSKSRGGAKMTNTQDLLKFQSFFVTFLGNMLLIGDSSISILRLLQNKQPKRQIFAHQVKKLVNRINQNKQIIDSMRQINDISSEGLVLMKIMFNDFYNDLQFVKEMQQKSRAHITSLLQKQIKTRLFNKKTTAIFINILDQTGKITKVSKNLPAVLGHSPSDLLGKSINQIIPFTIQPFHDDILIKFVQRYSKKTMRSDPRIQFFAYNKNFHLQQCAIRYNFVMSYFQSFQLSGVCRKIQQENRNAILMNQDGVLEGWTQGLANVFNFDQFQMGQCLKFNVMPLFPTLIKYYNKTTVIPIKTVFFRSGKVKEKALQISQFRNLTGIALRQKQLTTFKTLLQNDQIIEAYLVDLEYENLAFCQGKAKMTKIIIKTYERIQNFNEIQEYIIKSINGQKKQFNQQDELENGNMSKQQSISEYSVIGEQGNILNKSIDTNFTLNFQHPNAFRKQQIRLQSQVSKSQLSIELNDNNNLQQQNLVNDQINANAAEQQGTDSLIETSFSPKLQTQTNFIPFLVFIALSFIAIITWDQIVLANTQKLMEKQCTHVIDRNAALMIYAKSSFNPNATYIRQFDNAKLMETSNFLGKQKFKYKTFLGDIIEENKFYMFNVQIPSTLDRILLAPNDTRRAEYQKQIQYNFKNIMEAWMQRFSQSQSEWSQTIAKVRFDFIIRLVILCIGSIAFSLFLIYIYMQYRKQKKMTQAFFKFEKSDLDQKMSSIRKVIKNLQMKSIEWHLQKQFCEFVKKRQITNLQFQMEGNSCQTKIKFQTSDQAQQKLAKKKIYSILFFIVIFLLTQILFVILYSVLNFKQINSFETIPADLNKACKLTVLPNLMISNLFYQVPSTMISNYKNIQTEVLQKPLQNVPNLFGLLQQPPCIDCKFMYPLLTTNFRSFYSTFEQIINQKNANNDLQIKQLFYAVDVVVERVLKALGIKGLLFLPATVFLYIFSLTVFFLSVYFNIRKMIEQNQKLEVFLKYFDEEILVKNKHMNGLFNKNT